MQPKERYGTYSRHPVEEGMELIKRLKEDSAGDHKCKGTRNTRLKRLSRIPEHGVQTLVRAALPGRASPE